MEDNRPQEEERPEVFFIPNNFTDSGRIFNGMLSLRNAIEAGVIAFLLYKIEGAIITPLVAPGIDIVIMLCTIGPIACMALFGINGDCFTVFVKSIFTFLKNRKKMRFRRIKKDGQKNKSKQH